MDLETEMAGLGIFTFIYSHPYLHIGGKCMYTVI